MIYEPLKDKKLKIEKNLQKLKNKNNSDENNYYSGFEKGVNESFEAFASSIDAYKRYKNDVKLLMKEQQKIWSKWIKYYNSKNNINNDNFLAKYNDWLFSFIFSGIDNENSTGFLEF